VQPPEGTQVLEAVPQLPERQSEAAFWLVQAPPPLA
jgi:hypothetical protein